MITKIIGVREFRQNMTTLYEKAIKNKLRYIVLNRNKPVFKIEPLNKKDFIIEKLAEDIKEPRKQAKNGNVHDFETVCKELGL